MAWTSPMTFVATNILTALQLNTYLRDNTNYLKGLLDGTGSDAVILPSSLTVDDANFRLLMAASNPEILFDSGNDFLLYNRASDLLILQIGGTNVLIVNSSGKLTGTGFYDSGASGVSVGAGATVNFTHGFTAQPRLVFGVRGSAAGSMETPILPTGIATADVRMTSVTSSQVGVTNGLGSTQVCRIYAML